MRTAMYFTAAFAALAAATPLHAASIVIGMQQEPSTLDPTADATASIDTIFSHNVFESLVTLDEQANILPDLAKSWTVSDDGLTYTFKLQTGVKFHDGSDFNADDVIFSFDRAMAENSTNPTKKLFKPIKSVTAPDAETIVFQLSKPTPFFLFNMARGDTSIVAKETADTNKTSPVGTGPYKMSKWVRGNSITLVKNPDHRDAAKVSIDKATFRFVADAAAATSALLAGEIDAYPGFPAPESVDQFKADPRYNVTVGSTEGEVILALNNSRPPFNNLNVRRAVSHALNRQEIIDGAMFGFGSPIGSFFPPHHKAYVDLTGRYPHDIGKAKAELAAGGYKDKGPEVTLSLPHFPYARRSGEIIQQQLGKAGINVKIKNVEWGYWIGEVYKKQNYDMTIIAHVEPNDIGNFTRGPKYYYGYQSDAFDALYKKLANETDPAKLADLQKQAQRMIAEDAVHGFLFQLPRIGVYKKEVSGYWKSASVQFNPLIGWKVAK